MFRLAVGAVFAVAATSPVAVVLAAPSPRQLLASILAKARTQQSVHYVSRESLGAGEYLSLRADVAGDRGIQHVTDVIYGRKSRSITVIVVGDTAYVRGGERGLEDLVGLTSAHASRYAGKWISIPSNDKLYRDTAVEVTLPSLLQQITPHGRLRAFSKTQKGTKVTEIRGTSSGGQQTLDARRSAELPITESYVAAGGAGSTVLSRWNEAVHVRAPANAVPIATVRG